MLIKHIVVFLIILGGTTAIHYSCKDIYMENSNNPSGTYTIMNRHNQAYTVYCEFHKGYGYTYISNTSHVPINIDDLHTTTQHVMVRILKTNGQQKETKMEQLTRYQSQRNLTLMYNRYTDFAAPLNIKMSPYIYLGFLPVSMAKNTNTQGYRANGVNHEYQNCDANPNSYLVFYFNPHNIGPSGYYTGCCNTPLMHQWIDHATVLPHNKYLDPHFYFFFEMHMGGCGGYAIPQEYTDVQGAAIGFRFDYAQPCDSSPCKNHGVCYNHGTSFDCECSAGFSGPTCELH